MAATDVGTGSTITFQSGLFAEIINIDIDGVEIPVIDAKHMAGSDTAKKIFGRLVEPPQVTVECNLNSDKDWKAVIKAAAETVTITFPTPAGGSSGATWVFTGKVVGFSAGVPVEDKMTCTYVIQATTLPTFTASA